MDTTPIYKGQDFYVPYFQVKLNGKTQGKDVVHDVLGVTYKDDIKEVDSFELTINNWDAEKRTFKYTNEALFDPGKELELWMGYYGEERQRLMIKGKITSLRPSFPASGPPTLAISGLSLIHDLRKKQESHIYEKMKDSAIARKIGQRLKVKVRTDSEAEAKEQSYERLVQHNEYGIMFLLERARRIGYDIFVEETGVKGRSEESRIYFGPSVDIRKTVYELKYGASLIEFQPTLNLANQVGKVTVVNHNTETKEKITYTATRSQIKTKGIPRFVDSLDREEIVNKPVESREEARQLAIQTLERIAKEMIKASGTTVGLPDLRAGSVVMISGLDELFSGRYFVTSTTHTIGDGGYTTKFECRREDL